MNRLFRPISENLCNFLLRGVFKLALGVSAFFAKIPVAVDNGQFVNHNAVFIINPPVIEFTPRETERTVV